jgi:hypothetical protein
MGRATSSCITAAEASEKVRFHSTSSIVAAGPAVGASGRAVGSSFTSKSLLRID